MYLYHYYDMKKKEKLKKIGFLQNQDFFQGPSGINNSLANFEVRSPTSASNPLNTDEMAFAAMG